MCDLSTLSVLSYNIRHGSGMDGVIDLKRTAATMMEAQPDIIAVQEVDCATERSHGVDQADELARLTGMNVAFSKSIDYAGGEYGNVILSKFPIVSTQQVALPGDEIRSALLARLQLPKGTVIGFITTHLTLIRDLQWDSLPLLNDLAEIDEPVILAGDFNANPQSATIRTLQETWDVAGFGMELKSYPSDVPREQIDYIMAQPKGRMSLLSVKLIAETTASDHRPVMAVFKLS